MAMGGSYWTWNGLVFSCIASVVLARMCSTFVGALHALGEDPTYIDGTGNSLWTKEQRVLECYSARRLVWQRTLRSQSYDVGSNILSFGCL